MEEKLSQRRSPSGRLRQFTLLLWGGILLAIAGYFIFVYPHQRGSRKIDEEQDPARWRQDLVTPDTLTAVTLSGSTTYFTYRDEPMGYQYELIALWAEEVDIPLRVMPVRSVSEMMDSLSAGKADIAITPQPAALTDSLQFAMVGPVWTDYQVLAQYHGPHSSIRESTVDLVGTPIMAIEGTRGALRLRNLQDELLGQIDTIFYPDTITQEELIDWIATDSVPYAIADYSLVHYLNSYYGTIDYHLPLSTPQESQWIARRNLRGMIDSLQMWADTLNLDARYKEIYKRNFEYSKAHPDDNDSIDSLSSDDEVAKRPTTSSSRQKVKISDYDHLFQRYASEIGWDWEVLASIACQESGFRPKVFGGLMGIMAGTGKRYGYSKKQLKNAETSVKVATKILKATGREFDHIPDKEQRMKFTLAAYNAGSGHIHDACRLAEKYGADPLVWDGSVEKYYKLLSEPKYYNDPVVKYGYARGAHTVKYVKSVFERANSYRNKTN